MAERVVRERGEFQSGAVNAALDAILIQAGQSKKRLFFPAGVLQEAVSLFEGAACFADHGSGADLTRPGGRSVRDVLGLFAGAQWDSEHEAVRARLVVRAGQEWIADLVSVFQAQPERFGLSADLTLRRKGEQVLQIEEVHSVDVVMNPAAGGRFVRVARGVEPPVGGSEGASMSEQEAEYRVEVQTAVDPPPAAVPVVGAASPGAGPAAAIAAVEAGLAREVLAARLAGSGLPEPLQGLARQALADSGRLGTALALVDELRAAWATSTERGTVRGLGQVTVGVAPGQRIELAFERLMGLDPGPQGQGVARLTGIREMYDMLTGDWERHGTFRADRVTFANATTATMAEIVRNVLNKVMLKSFEMRPMWWKPIAFEDDFPNMNTVRWLTVGGVADLDTVTEGAAYTEKTWNDYAETADFVKKGNYIGLTLEMIDRDDVGAVRSLPRRLGFAAQRTLSAAVAAIFTTNAALADTVALFHGTHANLGAAALASASWDAAVQAMFKQPEFHSAKRLGIRPKFCLVPIELEATALVIFTSDQLPGGTNNDANVRRYSAQVISVPEWTDVNDWYAAAEPSELEGICVGYRYGRAPELYLAGDELMGSMFTNDEMRIKVRFVYAVGVGDYRALYGAVVA